MPQPQPYPFPVNMGMPPMQGSADPYMQDQLRRLEDTIRRQEARLDSERQNADSIKKSLQAEIDRIKGSVDPIANQYASAALPRVNPGTDDQDELLMEKLNDLENYLSANPNRNAQAQNPMAMFGVSPSPMPAY